MNIIDAGFGNHFMKMQRCPSDIKYSTPECKGPSLTRHLLFCSEAPTEPQQVNPENGKIKSILQINSDKTLTFGTQTFLEPRPVSKLIEIVMFKLTI